jgi:hypothetical protein
MHTTVVWLALWGGARCLLRLLARRVAGAVAPPPVYAVWDGADAAALHGGGPAGAARGADDACSGISSAREAQRNEAVVATRAPLVAVLNPSWQPRGVEL